MICNFGGWRGILNKYAPLCQACCSVFPRSLPEDLLDHAGEMSVVCLLTFARFMKMSLIIGCIHSIEFW